MCSSDLSAELTLTPLSTGSPAHYKMGTRSSALLHKSLRVSSVTFQLQRLDGPVMGNGKIIQELEGLFKGAGWNVVKVIWGNNWDSLLAKDTSGKLLQLMNETIDGDYQTFKSKDGAYVREHFFGKYPETAALVADMTDDEIFALGHLIQ